MSSGPLRWRRRRHQGCGSEWQIARLMSYFYLKWGQSTLGKHFLLSLHRYLVAQNEPAMKLSISPALFGVQRRRRMDQFAVLLMLGWCQNHSGNAYFSTFTGKAPLWIFLTLRFKHHGWLFAPSIWLTFLSNYTDNYLSQMLASSRMLLASFDQRLREPKLMFLCDVV